MMRFGTIAGGADLVYTVGNEVFHEDEYMKDQTCAIHPSAIIDAGAEVGAGVEVGPGAVIGSGVKVGDGCRIGPHAVLQGPLVLGEACVISASAAIGHDPQVKGDAGPFGGTIIGARNTFREFSQVHRSKYPDQHTIIGDDGYFMACSHIAHDCRVGDEVIMVNNAVLAGHVLVADRVFMSGNSGIHQFCRVGELSMIAGGAIATQDVPPFITVTGMRPARAQGLNLVGLRRAGVTVEVRRDLKSAYQILFRSDLPLSQRLEAVQVNCREVEQLVAFLASSERGVVGFGGRPPGPAGATSRP